MTGMPIPKVDRVGRPQHDPKRLMHGMEGALWTAERVPPRLVPDAYWQLDIDADGDPVAVVSCPCGYMPIAPALEALVECLGDACGRYFFFNGKNVWAYNSPTPTAPEEPDPDDATLVRP